MEEKGDKKSENRKGSDSDSEKSDRYEEMEVKVDQGPYPKRVFFILGNEFCERYSYYGMRTILVLYLKFYLEMTEDTATAVYHAFTVLCYLFPLFGAFIADSWLGKYKTILYLSVVYAFGMVLNTMGACPPIGDLTTHIILSSVGLLVIAIGTGGIKPCVSSFGGDQFTKVQEEYRRKFFSLFYFAINAGSLLSTAISPIIRDDVSCLGRDDCYALAFGIPAALMVVAIVTFVIGTPYYTIKPPEGNIFAEVSRAMGSAIRNRWNTPRKQRNKDHWMDYALTDTSAKLVRDVKYVLRVLILYIPLPLFWTLFDQQGSRWTLQATRMDGYIGSVQFKPDQMQIFNPLFIVTLIPLFEVTLYPCLRKLNINFSPLRRMTLGMILAGISFVLAALLQTQMDQTLTHIPEYSYEASFRVINSANCELEVKSLFWADQTLATGQESGTLQNFVDSSLIGESVKVKYNCKGGINKYEEDVKLTEKSTYNLVVSDDGTTGILKADLFKGIYDKSESGKGIVRIFNSLNYDIYSTSFGNITTNNISEKTEFARDNYKIEIRASVGTPVIFTVKQYVDTGGLYTIVVSEEKTVINSTTYVDVNPNDVSLFWMIPQYFVITVGEVFLSVTGLEFSYSQAPTSMKSVLASFWLLTVSIGNIIVLIIAEAKFVPSQADEYYLFAGLIGIAAIFFILLAIRYEYVDESEFYETEGERIDTKEFRNRVAETSLNDDKDKAIEANGNNAHDNSGFENEYSTAF